MSTPHPNKSATRDYSNLLKILHNATGKWKTDDRWSRFYEIYKDLHKNPGLSGNEDYAANRAYEALSEIKKLSSKFSLDIYKDIGKAASGPSVVGVLCSPGKGSTSASVPKPAVLLRADTDALPVAEETGCEYVSKKNMHACGHDMHTTSLMIATQILAENCEQWTGTVIACFQPSEESGKGAEAMINDGLYEKVPRPDFVFGSHVTPLLAGRLALTRGVAFSESHSWEITVTGRGGHGSVPESTIDPIIIAAYSITRLQTIVSRVLSSREAAVVTIGSINGGSLANIIPDTCSFKVNTRANSIAVSEKIEKEIRRIVSAEIEASGGEVKDNENPHFEKISHLPLLENLGEVTDDIASLFEAVFPGRFDDNMPKFSASEDFAHLARSSPSQMEPDIPYTYWLYGGTSEELWKKHDGDPSKLPSNHSRYFLPRLNIKDDNDPLKLAATALVAAALSKFELKTDGL